MVSLVRPSTGIRRRVRRGGPHQGSTARKATPTPVQASRGESAKVELALVHFRRGIQFSDEERLTEALQEFDNALSELPNDPTFLNNRGAALDRLGRHKKALADFDRVLGRHPEDAVAHHNRGVALAQLGRYEDAIIAYDSALAVKPKDAGTLANKGLALAHMGRLEDALNTLDKALRKRGANPNVRAARATIVGEILRGLRRKGLITWAGGKPKGSEQPLALTPGPDVSDYVIEDRR